MCGSGLLRDVTGLPRRHSLTDGLPASSPRCIFIASALARACTMPNVNWHLPLSGDYNDLYDHVPLGGMRQLIEMTRAAALASHVCGDDRTAIEHVMRMMKMAGALRQMPGSMGLITANGAENAAIMVLQEILPDLKMGENGTDRTSLTNIQNDLLDDQNYLKWAQWQLLAERRLTFNMISKHLYAYTKQKNVSAYRAAMLDYSGKMIACLRYPECIALTKPDTITYPIKIGVFGNHAIEDVIASLDFGQYALRYQTYVLRQLADRHMAALAIAIRFYAEDHQQKLPENLTDMINGKYISAISDDPMSASDVIHYLPQDARPRL